MKKELKHCFKNILKYKDAKIDCALETRKSGVAVNKIFLMSKCPHLYTVLILLYAD
eukprot:GAHX01005158.1.p1 GENE.GAHX01005158.1~~GAHX01005158.1.p1  ORF type:complete len:56 (-),score=7.00 GAHX01005158.1:51-218(-)